MDQPAPEIRQATPADIKPLLDLSLRTTRASYSGFLGAESVEAFIASGALDTFVRDSIERSIIATVDGLIVGVAVSTGGHIDQMMIDERYHRRGLGTALLHHLEEKLFEQHDTLQLDSFRDNDQANAFYYKHGWQKTGAYQDEDYGVEMIKMEKAPGSRNQ